MAICEDAPCCGCCGAAVWAADARASEDYYADPDRFYDQYEDYDDEDEEDFQPTAEDIEQAEDGSDW